MIGLSLRSSRALSLSAFSLLAATLVGCGEDTGNLSGKVLYEGKPLPSGRIVFICEGGKKPVLTSDIQNGAYSIKEAPVGPAKVSVATYEYKFDPVVGMPQNMNALPGSSAKPGEYVPIPARYNDPEQSGLTVEIEGGEQTHDFKLTP